MRRPARIGLAVALGAAWGIQAWSRDCPQDCDEADKVNGCCPQAVPVRPERPPVRPSPRSPLIQPQTEPASQPTAPAPVSASAGSKAGEIRDFNGVSMVWIPAGSFLMGSPRGDSAADRDEKPQHTVKISRGFWLGRVEVTQDLWLRVMGKNPWDMTAYLEDYHNSEFHGPRSPTHPASGVSWCDAIVFANKLSEQQKLQPAYLLPEGFVANMSAEKCHTLDEQVVWDRTASGYRLPTEAEWEYAAKAGQSHTRYAGSDDDRSLCQYGNVRDISHKKTFSKYNHIESFGCDDGHAYISSVGLFQPNNWGVHDMTGNVWEWVYDTYDKAAYRKEAGADPVSLQGDYRSIRGGDWSWSPDYLRISSRFGYRADATTQGVGVRLARLASPDQ